MHSIENGCTRANGDQSSSCLLLSTITPINEVVVTAAMARPELISPGDVSEAEVEALGLAAGLGFARDGPGPGK